MSVGCCGSYLPEPDLGLCSERTWPPALADSHTVCGACIAVIHEVFYTSMSKERLIAET
jgi:hypothetical protein